jgi:hypothetical protein
VPTTMESSLEFVQPNPTFRPSNVQEITKETESNGRRCDNRVNPSWTDQLIVVNSQDRSADSLNSPFRTSYAYFK